MEQSGKGLDGPAFEEMMAAVCRKVRERKDWLSELDAAYGDGNHGVSVARGFLGVDGYLASWSGDMTTLMKLDWEISA
jgi:dihydroxyacetone kinase-like protein